MKDESKDLPSGNYIAGFVDGEGCFALTFRRDVRHERKSKPIYYSWKAKFIICLRKDDYELLEKIKIILNCGNVLLIKNGNQARFEIQDLKELKDKIIPFFNKYQLYGKKKYDFILWSQAVDILYKYKMKHKIIEQGKRGFVKNVWEKKDISKLLKIQINMSFYKSKGPPWKWLGKKIGRAVEEK